MSVVSQLELKDNLIILGPNHTGRGRPFSIMADGSWITPLGEVKINKALADRLLKNSSLLEMDDQAHEEEHSIEVELPILQYYKEFFTFVPIAIASNDFRKCEQLGGEIASTIKELALEKDVLIVASSDMTHYEDAQSAKDKDLKAIKAILELSPQKLWIKIQELGISMCGYAPILVMIVAAKELGATKGELVQYRTSGDVTGDNSSVLGYAGIIIE